ncbi:MAG: tyrosinase family protein [Pseudonocardiales bacterium]|nr:tyrosinase family protein [Pseudonocardiales bacterium]
MTWLFVDMSTAEPGLVEIPQLLHEFRQQLFRTQLPDTHPASFAATTAPLITRVDQASLDASAQAAFLAAYNTLNSQGWLGPFVAIHADMSHRMHHSMGFVGAQRFLPWHRVYLHVLEQHLQSLNPAVSIPYWDWSTVHAIPSWLQGPEGMPTVTNVNGNNITVVRSPDDPNQLPSPEDVQNILGDPDFTTFENDLETAHDGVHAWVGGIMAIIPTAPADPLFWMHHANVDRIWTSWQRNNPGENPSLNPPDDTLDPWTDTELKTRQVSNYGYQYDALP